MPGRLGPTAGSARADVAPSRCQKPYSCSACIELLSSGRIQLLAEPARGESRLASRGVALSIAASAASPKRLARSTVGVLQQAFALRRERVQAGGDQRLHGVGQGHLLERAGQQVAVAEQAHELLRIQRVAAGALERECWVMPTGRAPIAVEQQQGDQRAKSRRWRAVPRLIVCALRNPAAQVGCFSISSGRAVPEAQGAAAPFIDRSAGCSRKGEHRLVEAQYGSSTASTAGFAPLSPSRKRRQAVKRLTLAQPGSPPTPSSGTQPSP